MMLMLSLLALPSTIILLYNLSGIPINREEDSSNLFLGIFGVGFWNVGSDLILILSNQAYDEF